MLKKGEYVKVKNYERQIKSSFIIYAGFESILVPENNGKQNPNGSCTNKYQKHIAWSHGYKLICVDDNVIKSFKLYLEKDAVFNFINSMTEESKYCNELMKKHFSRILVVTKEDNKIFRTLQNIGSVIMITLMVMLK